MPKMLRWSFHYILASVAFLGLAVTVWHSVLFLWNRDIYLSLVADVNPITALCEDGFADESRNSILSRVGVDVLLLSLFILQHSGMASVKVKSVFLGSQFEDLYRSTYILATAITVQILLYWWNWIPEVCLWYIDISETILTWWLFFLLHAFAWLVLYGGCLLMDFSEMVGVKQVYYRGCALESPLYLKSPELNTFYQHMRHPSFTALCLIFWCHPFMTLDRILLAATFTFYMIRCFCVDVNDYHYQKYQFYIKWKLWNKRFTSYKSS